MHFFKKRPVTRGKKTMYMTLPGSLWGGWYAALPTDAASGRKSTAVDGPAPPEGAGALATPGIGTGCCGTAAAGADAGAGADTGMS